MKLAEKIAWFRRDFVAILPVERAACDTCEASSQTGAWESNPVTLLKQRKLLILRVADCAENAKSA
jgi:hypothetical protein